MYIRFEGYFDIPDFRSLFAAGRREGGVEDEKKAWNFRYLVSGGARFRIET